MSAIYTLHFIVCCGPEHRTPAASSAVTRHISSQQGTQHCTIQSYLHNQLSTECHMVLSTIISMVVTRGWSSFHDCENIYNCENRYPYWYYLHHPHTGPRLVTLSARCCTPPWHHQLINLVTWVLYWERSEGSSGGWSPTRPPAHTLPGHTPTLHWDCGLCVLQRWRYSGLDISPLSSATHWQCSAAWGWYPLPLDPVVRIYIHHLTSDTLGITL